MIGGFFDCRGICGKVIWNDEVVENRIMGVDEVDILWYLVELV